MEFQLLIILYDSSAHHDRIYVPIWLRSKSTHRQFAYYGLLGAHNDVPKTLRRFGTILEQRCPPSGAHTCTQVVLLQSSSADKPEACMCRQAPQIKTEEFLSGESQQNFAYFNFHAIGAEGVGTYMIHIDYMDPYILFMSVYKLKFHNLT